MSDAPERIGLVGNMIGQWALACREEADVAVHYTRSDLCITTEQADARAGALLAEAVKAASAANIHELIHCGTDKIEKRILAIAPDATAALDRAIAKAREDGCAAALADLRYLDGVRVVDGGYATAIGDLAANLDRIRAVAQPDESQGDAAYVRTGVKDRDGREICVGDKICIDLSSPGTKKEYWKPEYEVVFKPPHFTLKHIGGGKDSDTAHFYWRVPQKRSTEKIITLFAAVLAQPDEAQG